VLIHHEVLALLNLLKSATDDQLVSAMKKLVPEFVSQNSTFERLDQAILEENNKEPNPADYFDLEHAPVYR
jgi:hypothetical protein